MCPICLVLGGSGAALALGPRLARWLARIAGWGLRARLPLGLLVAARRDPTAGWQSLPPIA